MDTEDKFFNKFHVHLGVDAFLSLNLAYTFGMPKYGDRAAMDLRQPFHTKHAKDGEPVGIRTRDPLIKSQMLYRLSYGLYKRLRIRGVSSAAARRRGRKAPRGGFEPPTPRFSAVCSTN